jgi:hypothetical protein
VTCATTWNIVNLEGRDFDMVSLSIAFQSELQAHRGGSDKPVCSKYIYFFTETINHLSVPFGAKFMLLTLTVMSSRY